MKINYGKVEFEEYTDQIPFRVYYSYGISKDEIDEFLSNEVSVKEIPEHITIEGVRLCLSVFSKNDFKLDAICESSDGTWYWITLNEMFTNADELIALIPDYEKSKLQSWQQIASAFYERGMI